MKSGNLDQYWSLSDGPSSGPIQPLAASRNASVALTYASACAITSIGASAPAAAGRVRSKPACW